MLAAVAPSLLWDHASFKILKEGQMLRDQTIFRGTLKAISSLSTNRMYAILADSANEISHYYYIRIGVGYSYSSIGEKVVSTEEASKETLAFIHLFFEVFSDLKGRPFHMTGGSYSGRSAPVFLSDILDFNDHAESKGLSKINIKSLSIGNGMTDYKK